MREVMQDLDAAGLDDFFSCRIVRTPAAVLTGERNVEIYRWTIDVQLDRRSFDRIRIDVGIGDPITREAMQRIQTLPILAFAEIPPTEISVVPLDQHIAEKLHAYVQDRGDRVNTRVKDIVDLALFSRMALDIAPAELRAAIERTFAAHGTDVPAELPPPPPSWLDLYAEVARNVDVPGTVEEAWREARALLGQALALERAPALDMPIGGTLVLATSRATAPEEFVVSGMGSAVLSSGAVSYTFVDLRSRAAHSEAFRDVGERVIVADARNTAAVRAAGVYAYVKWAGEPVFVMVDPDTAAAAIRALARSPVNAADPRQAAELTIERERLHARPLGRHDTSLVERAGSKNDPFNSMRRLHASNNGLRLRLACTLDRGQPRCHARRVRRALRAMPPGPNPRRPGVLTVRFLVRNRLHPLCRIWSAPAIKRILSAEGFKHTPFAGSRRRKKLPHGSFLRSSFHAAGGSTSAT